MAVNISVRQMRSPHLVNLIDNVLRRTGMRAADLCLELTESVLMEDVDFFERRLAGLKNLGLDLAIDDFGTGLLLTQLPQAVSFRRREDRSSIRRRSGHRPRTTPRWLPRSSRWPERSA